MRKVPVFIINGFLDSGKSSFILATIKRDEYYTRGKTLIIALEQGEIEYDEAELERYNTKVVYVENEEDFNPENLKNLYLNNKANRIVLEANFLWKIDESKIPDFFDISQYITIVDGVTFPVYYPNMRQQFNDVFKQSEVVAFTKLNNDRSSLQGFETGLKMTNANCLYCLIDESCISTCEAFDTPLPYDINADVITLEDKDFAAFYIDTFDHRDQYENKVVEFNAWVALSDKLNEGEFIAGRKVLNCCAQDVQLYGYLVQAVDDDGKVIKTTSKGNGKVTHTFGLDLKQDSWVKIKAKCHEVYNPDYEENEVVLTPLEITPIKPLKDEIIDLRG